MEAMFELGQRVTVSYNSDKQDINPGVIIFQDDKMYTVKYDDGRYDGNVHMSRLKKITHGQDPAAQVKDTKLPSLEATVSTEDDVVEDTKVPANTQEKKHKCCCCECEIKYGYHICFGCEKHACLRCCDHFCRYGINHAFCCLCQIYEIDDKDRKYRDHADWQQFLIDVNKRKAKRAYNNLRDQGYFEDVDYKQRRQYETLLSFDSSSNSDEDSNND